MRNSLKKSWNQKHFFRMIKNQRGNFCDDFLQGCIYQKFIISSMLKINRHKQYMSIKYILLFSPLLILIQAEVRPLKCDPPQTQIQKAICPPYIPPNPTPSLGILQGCQKMLDSQKCQTCKRDYVLIQENGTCLSLKVLSDIKTEALDIGEPIVDITDKLEEQFGPSASSVNDFNLRNHPHLKSYEISRGISQSAILGIYITLFYVHKDMPGALTMIIGFTECSGRINQLFYYQSQTSNVRGPVAIAQRFILQLSGVELFLISKIEDPRLQIFHIYMRNGSDIFYLVYYLNEESFRERAQSSLIQIVRPYVAIKLQTLNSDFDLNAANATSLSDRTVLFRYRNSSISAELFGCNIIVNNIITARPIADSFYSVFEKAKTAPSLIPNLPEYKDIIRNDTTSSYKVIFGVTNKVKKEQISIEVVLVDAGQESRFQSYVIDGVQITQALEQADRDIKFDPPDADNKFSYKLENLYCKLFKEGGFLCEQCIQGYKLTGNGFCVDDNCLEFLLDKCIKCRDGYQVIGSTCEKNVEFCVSYNTLSGNCKQCVEGFYLSDANTCLQIPIQNCKVFSDRNRCEECLEGYYLYDSVCLDTQRLCLQFSQDLCVQCVIDFYPKNGVCTPSPCPRGYLIKPNDDCAKIPDRCSNYDVNKYECASCQDGFHLLNQECLPDILNCVNYDQQNLCTKCEDRFYVTDNVCLPVSEACQTYNETNGWCLTCKTGALFVVASGKCLSASCEKGYYMSPGGYCKKIPSYCSNFNAGTQTCLACDPPTKLTNGVCVLTSCQTDQAKKCVKFDSNQLCLQCIPGYYLTNNLCEKASPLCLANSKTTNTCTVCHPGFRLSSGTCINTGVTCLVTGKNGICISCPNRTFLYQGLCVPVSDNCKTWETQTGLCTSCYAGYLRFGICLDGNDPCA